MTRELRDIPPARRSVRLSAALAFRWPLGLIGATMTVYGGLVALMFFFWAGGKPSDDRRLDRGAATATAVVLDVTPIAASISDRRAERFHYEFRDAGDVLRDGRSYGPAGSYSVGGDATVEFLREAPETNRLAGTRISLLGDFVTPVLALVVLPGGLVLLLWLRLVLDQRRVLATGIAAVAWVQDAERLRLVLPTMLSVRYRFRDHRAQWREGRHWVRARSPLGARLQAAHGPCVVVHDRDHPQRSRLVTAADFAPSRSRPRAMESTERV